MTKRKRGKPPKLTREAVEAVAAHLRIGSSRRDAASAIHVDERTLRRWNKKGKEGVGGLYGELWKAVVEAEAEYRAPKPEPRPRVTLQIVEATIRGVKDGLPMRTPIDLTLDQYDALCRACSDSEWFNGLTSGRVYRPRPEDRLTAQQQEWVDHMLHVTLCDSAGTKTRDEFRSAE
jgi:transposase-like protein